MRAIYIETFEELKKALKYNKCIVYITKTIYPTSTIKINNNIKLIGVNKITIDCCHVNSTGIYIRGNNNVLKNLIIRNAGDCGVRIKYGQYNTIINCSFCYNNNSGLSITKYAAYNTIINCNSYLNCDYHNFGKSADGFSCKLHAGINNKFINCYSFYNSDDGFDNYDNYNSVYYINCVAYKNGYTFDINNKCFKGNGNGFKLGSINVNNAYRYLKNCSAFNNRMKGFDQNNSSCIVNMYNCNSQCNKVNYKLDKCTLLTNN